MKTALQQTLQLPAGSRLGAGGPGLRRSRAEYHWGLVSSFPMWVFNCISGAIVAANEAAARAYGYTRDELLACTIRDLCASRDPDELRLMSLRNGGPLWIGPWKQRRKDGTPFDAEIGLVAARDDAEQPVAMVIVNAL